MTVYFVGAGPGASDLITVRGLRLLEHASVVIYAGSLVSSDLLKYVAKEAVIYDSAVLTLDQIISLMVDATASGKDVVRLHSGDSSIYGAIGEQMRRLRILSIAFEIVPGVPAFAAAAARLQRELTLPGVAQTVILTRTATRASTMPEGENLAALAASRATLVLHLAVTNLANVVRSLLPFYGPDCPAVAAYRVSWPDELVIKATLATLRSKVKDAFLTRTTLIMVGEALGEPDFCDSALYNPAHHHIFRRQTE